MAVDPQTLLGLLPDWAQGNARIAALLEKHQAIPPALENFGVEQFQAGDAAMAVKAFEAALALAPGQAVYQNNLGVALNAAGDPEGAISAFFGSLEIERDQPQIWLNLAYTVRSLGRLDEAEQALSQASGYEETAVEALTGLAQMAAARGDNAATAQYYARAVELAAGDATLHGSLGAALFQIGAAAKAAEEYQIAYHLNPREGGFKANADFLTMVAGILDGNAEEAIAVFAKPLEEDALLQSALDRAMVFLTSFDHTDAARALADEWIQYYPDDEDARYFQQVFSGKDLSRAPATYIAHHFDRLADVLTMGAMRSMDYQVPAEMKAMLTKALGRKWRGAVLDAGCGNGTLGVELKKFAANLTGVDLSPRMISHAKTSGLYDAVVAGDLLEFLQIGQPHYDLIAAGDSLIYFGTLDPILRAAHTSLKPGGWFIFNIETNDGTEPYTLMPNGRFAHDKYYLTEIAARFFTVADEHEMVLRLQGEKPVQGAVLLLQKK